MRINPGAINGAPTGNVGGALMRPGRGKNIITFRMRINPGAINGRYHVPHAHQSGRH